MLSSPWEDLSLDFIIGLPPSHGYTTILLVVDLLTKGAHFDALTPHHITHKVTSLFFDMVCKLHDFPSNLVSDRDPIFVGLFWHKLFTMCGIKLCMSTSHHPEMNEQTKVLNHTLEQYLKCFVSDTPTRWFNFLSLAEWCYNTSIHSATGITPFEATYGKVPSSIPRYLLGSSSV